MMGQAIFQLERQVMALAVAVAQAPKDQMDPRQPVVLAVLERIPL